MSQDYDIVARMWVAGDKPKKTYFGVCGSRYRMSYDERDMNTLLSYEHFGLAVKLETGHILVNGDTYSNTTTKQQNAVRAAVRKGSKPWAIIPFSALRAAGISPKSVDILEMTTDREVRMWVRASEAQINDPDLPKQTDADGVLRVERVEHFLGETLFTYAGECYVCGLDRNDDVRKRHFFLAKLPRVGAKKNKPKSVDEALLRLRPKGLPEDALRQGEWFFVAEPGFKPDLKKGELFKKSRPQWAQGTKQGVPIEYDEGAQMRSAQQALAHTRLTENIPPDVTLSSRVGRHMASRMFVNGKVYVQGRVRDAQHSTLVLGDGKTWFRVVKNLSTGSWSAGGNVD